MGGKTCRGTCVRNPKMPYYALRDKYCGVCSRAWRNEAATYCPCCGAMLRTRPTTAKLRRNVRARQEAMAA